MFPVEDPALADEIRREVLETALRDNVALRRLHSSGQYERMAPQNGDEPLESQRVIIQSRLSRARTPRTVPREAP
jgi:polyphosphate kinase